MDEQTRKALRVIRDTQQAFFWAMLDARIFPIGSDWPKIITKQLRELSDLLISRDEDEPPKEGA